MNLISSIQNEEIYDKDDDKAIGIFRKIDSDDPYEEVFDQNGKN